MQSTTEDTGSTICLKRISELLKDKSGRPAVYPVVDYQRG